ncbi:hypothetical protein Plhal304r1_c013g0048681 [Plasmopara halstedii]
MWIPAARLTTEHRQDAILSSLASVSQPAVWRECLVHHHNFQAYARRVISSVCTSDDALKRPGNLRLTVCGISDLRYGSTIYDWFVQRGARPVLITPTHVHGQVKSRGRTVYFNSVGCPAGFLNRPENLREIHFDSEEKPCFVQHRLASLIGLSRRHYGLILVDRPTLPMLA